MRSRIVRNRDISPEIPSEEKGLTESLEKNISLFQSIFSGDEMLVVRSLENKYLPSARCCVIYFSEMADNQMLNENIIGPVLRSNLSEAISTINLLEELKDKVIIANDITKVNDIDSIVSSLIEGNTLFLLDGYSEALIIGSKGWQTRAITEPESSKVIRGPREGFTESILQNITLVRRRIKDKDLKLKFKEIGTRSHTKICICYIEGLALDGILKELERRLDEIDIDAVLDSGYIQEFIKDAPLSPFETVGFSERPDTIASKILEGRYAIFVDGSPNVLTVPYVLIEAIQSSEDYYNNYIFASINRLMRAISSILSLSIPALYLAVTTYHQEMIPTPLLLSISVGRKDVPFPTVFSLIVMLTIFDVLREVGVRMPTPIGQAINIVGTLVLGQAAVEAKLVSPHVIIITALTGILSLMSVTLIGANILIRTLLLLVTSVLGIYGFLFGFIILILHLLSIRSFGVPYMLNITRVKDHNFQDAWIRAPWWEMTLRPKIIAARNLVRQSTKKAKESRVMMRTKDVLIGLILCFNCIFASSCWNYREIDQMSIVAGAAIDKGPEDTYKLTVEIVEFSGQKNSETNSKIIALEGKTIFDAARNAISYEGKRLFWSHAKVVIIGKDISEENVVKITDWFIRDSETRSDIHILVSKEKTAKEILESMPQSKGVRSFDIRDMVKNEKSLSKAPEVVLWEFANDLMGKGVSAIAPAVELAQKDGEIGPHLSGTAIFKRNKLVGFIGEEDTKNILFVRNEIKGGVLVQVESDDEGKVPISLEIFKSKTKIKPVNNGENIEFNVNIDCTLAIDEIGGTKDCSREDIHKELERSVGEALATRIKTSINKVQTEYGSDVFGFGTKIREDNPRLWKNVEKDWENKFNDVKVNVNVKAHIKNSAMLSKPLKIGD